MTVELHLARDTSISMSSGGFARPPVFGMERDFADSPASLRRSRQSPISHSSSSGGGRSAVALLRTLTTSENPNRTEQFAVPASVPRVSSSSEMGRSGTSSGRLGNERGVQQFTDSQEAVFQMNCDRSNDSSTLPCMRWAESLSCLLEDSEGVRLFKQFLDAEHDSAALDFWFACCGLQMVAESDQSKVDNLVKLIFKKYIKNNQLNLRPDMRKRIVERLKGGSSHFERSIYEESKSYIEEAMSSDTYPLFLHSDIYLQYVQSCGETNSSSAASTRPMSAIALPTLPEDEELRQEDITGAVALSLTSNNLAATIGARSSSKEGLFAVPSRVPNPYHVHYHNSYVPPSAQDSASEMQSLSSGATDDTISQADSAIDGRDARRWRQQVMRKSINANRHVDTHSQQPFIPRTEKELPSNHDLSEKYPERFAALLTDRLRLFADQQRRDEEKLVEVREKIRNIEVDSGAEDMMELATVGGGPAAGSRRLNTTCVAERSGLHLSLMASMMAPGDGDDDESILDNHMSRIWHSSGQTPCRSPPAAAAASLAASSSFVAYSPGRARRSLLSLPATQTSAPAIADVVLSGRPKRRETVHGAALRLPDDGQSHGAARPGGVRSRYQQQQELVDSAYSSQVNEPVWFRPPQPVQAAAASGRGDTHPAIAYDPSNDKVSKWIMSNEVHTDRPSTQYSTDASERSSVRKSSKTNSALRGGASSGRREAGDVGWMAASPSGGGDGRSQRHQFSTSTQSHALSSNMSATTHHDLSLPIEVDSRTARHAHRTGVPDMSQGQQRDVMPPLASHHAKMPPPPPPPRTLASSDRAASAERQAAPGRVTGGGQIAVAYYWCGEPVPYRSNLTLPDTPVTLAHVKQVIAKKGNFRYFFKTVSDEFDVGVVHMEISDDNAVVPLFDNKIICKVEKLD